MSCSYADHVSSSEVYCKIIKGVVDFTLRRNYCLSESLHYHCPCCGGDDRFRNPECLTEEVCAGIRQSVRGTLYCVDKYICESLARIMETATMTGYEYLGWMICQYAGDYIFHPPNLTGTIEALVRTNPEKKRAVALERDLTGALSSIKPTRYLSFSGCRGLPNINSQSFSELARDASYYGYEAKWWILTTVIDTGGTTVYEKPIKMALKSLGDEIEGFFYSVCYGIDIASNAFERGCSSAFSGIGNSTGYSGNSVVWKK